MAKAISHDNRSAATPVASTASAVSNDPEMIRLADEIDRKAQRQLVDLIGASTRGVLTLFPYQPRNPEEGKLYPAMTGHLDTRQVRVPVSAFAKRTEEGREYLSLAVGPAGEAKIGGAVFRDEEQDPTDGRWVCTPGKADERHGVIARSERLGETEDYRTVFELRFFGRRRLSAGGVPYIRANVYADRQGTTEADAAALAGCF